MNEKDKHNKCLAHGSNGAKSDPGQSRYQDGGAQGVQFGKATGRSLRCANGLFNLAGLGHVQAADRLVHGKLSRWHLHRPCGTLTCIDSVVEGRLAHFDSSDRACCLTSQVSAAPCKSPQGICSALAPCPTWSRKTLVSCGHPRLSSLNKMRQR